jgi:hypothetical protein
MTDVHQMMVSSGCNDRQEWIKVQTRDVLDTVQNSEHARACVIAVSHIELHVTADSCNPAALKLIVFVHALHPGHISVSSLISW